MAAAFGWLAAFGVLDATGSVVVISMFGVAPLIVAALVDERRTAVLAAAASALALAAGWWHGITGDVNYWSRVAAVVTVSTMAMVVAGVRRRREERLARMTAIAEATQLALLPPLPPQITGLNVAARYRSATREALVGGDLYEIIPSGRGVRVIIGDVRGKGLDAVRLAGQVLSQFRRSAVALAAIEEVAHAVGRAIGPLLGDEDFVTAVLAEIAPTGEVTVVNCGHHPPLLCHCDDVRPLADGKVALPLGLEDEFTAFTAVWPPGDRLLFYTDGLVESRDKDGAFLPADAIGAALAASSCDEALDGLIKAVHKHTGGNAHDDMALLLLEHGASERGSANGSAPAIRAAAG